MFYFCPEVLQSKIIFKGSLSWTSAIKAAKVQLVEGKTKRWLFLCDAVCTAHRNLSGNKPKVLNKNDHRIKRLTVGADILHDHSKKKKEKSFNPPLCAFFRTWLQYHRTSGESSWTSRQWVQEEDFGVRGWRLLPGPRHRVLADWRGESNERRGDGQQSPTCWKPIQNQQQAEGSGNDLVHSRKEIHLHRAILQRNNIHPKRSQSCRRPGYVWEPPVSESGVCWSLSDPCLLSLCF